VRPFVPPETDDIMALDVIAPQSCFGSNFPGFMISNSHSTLLPPAPDSVSPQSSLLDLDYHYLVAGDFNMYNSATNPSGLLFSKKKSQSALSISKM